jgi:putative CocE/NonD family hydrolase
MRPFPVLALLAVLLLPTPALAQPPALAPAPVPGHGVEYIRAHYTKYEYRIPMRDGTKLFTAVYVPKDTSTKYPILLNRTPYGVGPYGVDKYPNDLGPSPLFAKEGYIFVKQDVRGRMMSEGEHVNMRPHRASKGRIDFDESSDTYDTIDWLLKNIEGHNGKVGQYGISYPGFYTTCGMIDAHPALVAASPQAPISDWFVGDDFHHNGCLFLPHCFNFMATFGKPREGLVKRMPDRFDHGMPDGYRFFLDLGSLANADKRYFKGSVAFWNEIMQHGTYDDFWQSRNLRPHIKNIKPAVLTVGGWFDAENLFGALETYKAVDRDPSSTKLNCLVMGPWTHGAWSRVDGDKLGDVNFGQKTGVFYREEIEFPFFETMLKGKGDLKYPRAWVFETGTNQWRKFDTWPPVEAKPTAYYLAPNGLLTSAAATPDKNHPEYDEYLSDPNRPVPYAEKIANSMFGDYMIHDQRFASKRPDVLVYTGPVLEKDVRVAGPVEVELHVATSGTDSDWVVKVIDVYPDDAEDPTPNPTGVRMGGYQQLVRAEPFRGKFRNSFTKPEPFEPNKPTVIRFTLPDIGHSFRPGHRIMVQVQSSWFPLMDRNPQTFCDIYAAKETDFQKATQRVYNAGDRASKVTLRVLP